jgi:hypothetical protein
MGASPAQKIVVLTNYPTPHMREVCRSAGANAFFDESTELDEFVLAPAPRRARGGGSWGSTNCCVRMVRYLAAFDAMLQFALKINGRAKMTDWAGVRALSEVAFKHLPQEIRQALPAKLAGRQKKPRPAELTGSDGGHQAHATGLRKARDESSCNAMEASDCFEGLPGLVTGRVSE